MDRPPSSLRPSLAPARPTSLGRYEIVAKIAGGGTASIYLGRTADSPPAVVAIKTMLLDETAYDETAEKMFLDEASLLARLEHPNVVRIYESGIDGGQRFIAMELLLGVTLAALFDTCAFRGIRLEHDMIGWIGWRIADALHYTHSLTDEAGGSLAVIHRDVNPSNVFVTFDGNVKLFDFGMAKSASRRTSTVPGIVKGKLPYLAPEQIMQLAALDGRADIFSLGTTLWELCTLRRLFRRDTDIETVKAVHVGAIPDPRTVSSDLPPLLADIVMRALQRNRDHRYPTAAHMSSDLETFLNHESPGGVPARLSVLLDHVFPDERKRQANWLKPAVTTAPPRSASADRAIGSSRRPDAEPPRASTRPSYRPPVPLPSSLATRVRDADAPPPPAPPSEDDVTEVRGRDSNESSEGKKS